ncbi:hypothetical protein ACI7YT_10805 [Microbacterium sp. M]|uniref:hypothetical protein n=1 Tax=Microbacterium sp. M TaxID=3377125 RepID=UPI003864CD0E
MSTSDSEGKEPLTRKQLREIRLTGATPVITAEEAAAASAPAPTPQPPLPRAAEPAEVPPAPVADEAVDLGALPLTRRQARDQERIRTASVPVIGAEEAAAAQTAAESDAAEEAEARRTESEDASDEHAIVSAVPVFAPVSASAPAQETDSDDEDAADVEVEQSSESAVDADAVEASADADADDVKGETPDEDASADTEAELVDLGVDADATEHVDDDADDEQDERPTVNPTFGQSVLSEEKTTTPFTPSFDELIAVSDSTGSQHAAPSALIFNPPPGEGSLSGPVASTGEVLITGSYDLPEGLGSRGHAKGTTDGKDVDAVLIDGELPPASSPTPIAASSAVSTIKPAGEVIRPPAPEKGNKLMLILAITAGGLALALAAALIIAFTTNVL